MIYWIEDAKNGSKLGLADTKEQAESMSDYLFKYKGIDNYIKEEE